MKEKVDFTETVKIFTETNGMRFESTNDKQTVWYQDGSICMLTYLDKDGETPNGMFKHWDNEGNLLACVNYKNGEMDGNYRCWDWTKTKKFLNNHRLYKNGKLIKNFME